MEAPVRLDIDDGLAHLSLARPDTRNAIDGAMVEGLREAVGRVRLNAAIRAVLISARGPAFTVGGDLRRFAAAGDGLSDELASIVGGYHEALVALHELDLPIVVALQGAAAGGGLGLAYVGDIVIAADDLVVATGFSRIGLSGDGGWSRHLPRLIGLRRTQELLYEGRVLDARTALEWGLVTRVVEPDRLREEATAAARRLAAGPTQAFAEMRRLLRATFDNDARSQYEAERAGMRRTGATEDARDAIADFLAKREPRFSGR